MRIPRRSLAAQLGVALCACAVLAGCQTQSAANRQPHVGATTASDSGGIQHVRLVVGNNGFRFDPSTVTVHPGKVEITLSYSGSGAPHDWQLLGIPADYVPLTSSGQSNSYTFTAPAPGRYTFVCTIHVKQGQTGTLVVLPS
jgi:plastocyanin